MNLTDPLHPEAVAVRACRAMPDGSVRLYTIAEPTSDPWGTIDRTVRRAAGHIRSNTSGTPYAVLDVLDENDDIVQDFAVPDARSWRYVYRKFGFRVDEPN